MIYGTLDVPVACDVYRQGPSRKQEPSRNRAGTEQEAGHLAGTEAEAGHLAGSEGYETRQRMMMRGGSEVHLDARVLLQHLQTRAACWFGWEGDDHVTSVVIRKRYRDRYR